MLSLDIVDSDQFTDLLPTARLLYYELGVRADDDGFVGNPRMITRFVECSEEGIKILENKGFIYMLDSGVLTIRNWLANNQLRNDRYHETYYKNEKSMLGVNPNNKTYYLYNDLELPDCLTSIAIEEIRKKKKNLIQNKKKKKSIILLIPLTLILK